MPATRTPPSHTVPKRPTVALVFEYGTLNGGEHSILTAIEHCRPAGWDFVAIAPEQGRLAEALRRRGMRQIPVCWRDADGRRLPRDEVCRNLVEAVRQSSADLVHANSLSMGRLTGAVSDQLAVPCLAHVRDIIKLSRAAVADLNRNRLLLTVSQATRAFHERQGVHSERMRVLYNGVDCRRFRPRAADGRLRKELGIPAEAWLILIIGQIGLRKGQDVLAEAAARGRDRLPQAHYLLVGERNSSKAESVRFEQDLIGRFAQAGLSDRLHRLGYREDVPALMNEADLLVHCAHQEPLGRVLLEAAASGLPILATDVGGTREIVTDGESARLIPPNDPAALAEALVELHDDASHCHRLAAAARRRAERTFPAERAAEKLAEIWSEFAVPAGGSMQTFG